MLGGEAPRRNFSGSCLHLRPQGEGDGGQHGVGGGANLVRAETKDGDAARRQELRAAAVAAPRVRV
jgi:hypothetical protein